ncbi:hypothetical protein Patl1_25175 [Pistacia atlantica]|uniref:Uncharacterized protein n=1 Tax=Pistacia atlantica TaxID=434234 RepID=A0ACC1B4X6_9ROSI|nr:hypothetical protein Patl1_25175 [Pistacia atlantica]
MAFASFIGRVMFASVFILSAWQEFNDFGIDGGPAAKSLEPKFNIFSKHVSTHTGLQVPEVEVYQVFSCCCYSIEGCWGPSFHLWKFSWERIFWLLLHQAIATPILYDFYNYDADKKEFGQLFSKFTQSLALFGALLFFIGMKNSMPRRQLRKKALKTKTV